MVDGSAVMMAGGLTGESVAQLVGQRVAMRVDGHRTRDGYAQENEQL